MCRIRAALLASTLIAVACSSPPDAGWTPPAARPPPPRAAMFLALDQGDLALADALLDDAWPARSAGSPTVRLSWPLTWTEDPEGDATFRFGFYSLSAVEHLWFAYRTRGAPRYLDKLHAILRSFLANDAHRAFDERTLDDPRTSAYRAMVLTDLHAKLGRAGALPADLGDGIRASIARTARFLMEPMQFEHRVKDGLVEAAALLVVAHNFPDLDAGGAWRTTGLERLELMRTTQVAADGSDREDSPQNQLAVLGLATQIGAWAAAHEPSIAPAWDATTRAMVRYLAYVTEPNGKLPALGATSSTIVPNQEPELYGPLAAVDPEFAWVWSRGEGGTPPARRAALFPHAGLFVLRAPNAAAEQTFVTFEAGLARAKHGHLDALSTTVYSDGATLVPDSGLYTHEPGAAYDYFHGTRAHNTVVVDGKDQPEGQARAGAYGIAGKVAWATGESALYDGVTHRRTVVVLDQGLVLVTDDLASDGVHDYAQTWHFFPGAGLALNGVDVDVANVKGAPILLVRQADPAGISADHAYGRAEPMQGWVSLAYGAMEPAHAVEYRRHAAASGFATLFVAGRRARSATPARVAQRRDQATGARVVTVCADGANATVTIVREGTREASVVVSGGGC
jgi:hypothetical protein